MINFQMRKKTLRWILVLLPVLGLIGCGSPPASTKDEGRKLKVLATTGMIGSVAADVLQGLADVEVLMGPGIDPHQFKPTPKDLMRLREADIILTNGLHLEGKMTQALDQLGKTKPVLKVAENQHDLQTADGAPDPHVWMDPVRWAKIVDPIENEVFKHLTSDTDRTRLKKQADAVISRILDLNRSILRKLSTELPKERRVLITAHDAFRYFGTAYGFEVHGIQGISTESEAGLKEINALVDLIVAKKVKAIFAESTVSPKNVQALLDGAKSKGADVKLGGLLYSDALGDAGTPDGTYVGMIEANVNTIVEALK